MLSDSDTFARAPTPQLAALVTARQSLEAALSANADWRALRRLENGAGRGEATGASAAERHQLIVSVSALPDFLAWQLIDTAIGCIATNQHAPTPPSAPLSAPATAAPDLVDPRQSPARNNDRVRSLAMRIPTLTPNPARATRAVSWLVAFGSAVDKARRVAEADLAEADLAEAAVARALTIDAATANRPATSHVLHGLTRTVTAADEAEVTIFVRQTRKPTYSFRLPALPLVRQRRTANPFITAGDEAEVAIINRRNRTEAEIRQARRALGVAPGRETTMNSFLKALAGE